jgi:hypothetical protein
MYAKKYVENIVKNQKEKCLKNVVYPNLAYTHSNTYTHTHTRSQKPFISLIVCKRGLIVVFCVGVLTPYNATKWPTLPPPSPHQKLGPKILTNESIKYWRLGHNTTSGQAFPYIVGFFTFLVLKNTLVRK